MAEKKEYKIEDIKPETYEIWIIDREYEGIGNAEFQVEIDDSTESKTTDRDGIIDIVKPKNGKITLSL